MDLADTSSKASRIKKQARRATSKEVRRRQLIEATIESIAKYGLTGTTITTVTGFAGMSTGIVNLHFDNKENLFEETLRHLAEEHREQWRKTAKKVDLEAKDKLLAIVDAEFHPKICNHKKLTVWAAFYGEAGYRVSYRRIMSEIDSERWDASKALCAEIIADGGYGDLDAEDIAETLEGLFDGFCLNILIYPGEFTNQDAKTRVHAYLASIFPGHFDRPAKTSSRD